MKKLCTFVIFLLLHSWSFATLNAYFSYATFDQPGNSTYVESYLNIMGRSVKIQPDSKGKFLATLEIQWVYKRGDKIVHFDKYNLHSPQLDSITQSIPDFIDQQRVVLDTGDYTVELKIADKNSGEAPLSIHQNIRVFFPTDKVSVSDIELLESYTPTKKASTFTKSGYDLVPFIMAYYPPEITTIKFYAEIYRTKALLNEDYLVRYFIANNENRVLQNDLVINKKQSPAEVNVILAEIPIDGLISGNYNLILEVRSKENKLITYQHVLFQRSNVKIVSTPKDQLTTLDVNGSFISEVDNPDTLKEYIACLAPISSNSDLQIGQNQIALGDVQSMKQFILHFWTSKDPEKPFEAWKAYQAQVMKVNAMYSTWNKPGYESDRGRVYLQYGMPNAIASESMDPNAIPYEIWQYYKVLNQSNRKFVFYNPDGVSNDYRLLHSDAKGELRDDAWELKLHSRSQQFNNPDQQNSQDIYGTKTKENFKNPK